MTSQPHNPFVLPGFGQSGDMAHNPLMASMEMMRQAWQGLAGAGGLDHAAMAAPMGLEELDRRISDLRAVENWLRMNLSMLSSTIQGLEVQRATISTLKSFMHSASPGAGASAEHGPSPLEVVLGIKPEAQRDVPPEPTSTAQPASPTEPEPETAAPDASTQAMAGQAGAAAQGWWDMLQKQFDTLAAATAATLQNAEAARTAAQQFEQAASDSTLGAARKAPAKAAAPARPARKTAKKAAARKRAPVARRKES